jgi:hypothetical protein
VNAMPDWLAEELMELESGQVEVVQTLRAGRRLAMLSEICGLMRAAVHA